MNIPEVISFSRNFHTAHYTNFLFYLDKNVKFRLSII